MPPGERLRELALAQEFGTSQAPVREALRRLSSMRRHILSRPTWRVVAAKPDGFCPSRYASIRALSESTLFDGSVHYEIRLLGLIGCCNLLVAVSPFSGRPSPFAQSPRARSEAVGHKPWRVRRFTIDVVAAYLLLFGFAMDRPSFPSSRLASEAVRVSKRLIDLRAHPQTVQKHRELRRYGYHCSFLCIFASPRSYLFSMTS